MSSVTILNGTNVPINSCISAGVNYSWCNRLSPRKYYHHEGGAGVFTLNTMYWGGEASEYKHSGAEIGLWTAGIVIGVIGFALIPFTMGSSSLVAAAIVAAAGTMSGAIAIGGAVAGVVGLTVSGISIAAREFANTPATYTNIHALEDRKFIAEGLVEFVNIPQADGSVTMEYKSTPNIVLRKLSDEEYYRLLNEQGYTEHQSKPLVGSYASSTDIASILNRSIGILPNNSQARWEIEDDQTKEGAPVQIWDRDGSKVVWNIKPATDATDNNQFYIYNPALDRYVTGASKLDQRVTSSKESSEDQRFHILKIEEHNSYAFIPVKSKNRVITTEGGNKGNSTKLVLGDVTSIHPDWAMWRLVSH